MKNRPIKYLVTTYWEIGAWSGFECSAEDSIDEWSKDNQSFLEKFPEHKCTLLNIFPIPEKILRDIKRRDMEDEGIESKISYNY